MIYSQLEHGIRAACRILGVREVYVVGSQSLLASYPNVSGPLARSNEMDVLAISSGAEEISFQEQQNIADLLNGNIGEGTVFAATFGFEVEGVVAGDLVLPPGWRERTCKVETFGTEGCIGHCLEPYDMAVAKVAAERPKDRAAVINLIRQGILKPRLLEERVRTLSDAQLFDGRRVEDLVATVGRWAAAARNRTD